MTSHELKFEAQPAPAEPRSDSFFRNLPSIWKLNAEIRWLVADMIPLKGITLLSAASGTGKTWLAYAIAGAVAHGSRFLGREVIQRPVLYLDGENPLAIVKRDLKELGVGETNHLRAWGGWHSPPPPSPDNSEILQFAKEYEPLLIWDSLVEFHDGDEQSASGTRKFMKYFRELANAGATIIILHHTGKTAVSQEYRGSSDIKASVDMAYVIEGDPRDGALYRLTMRSFKSRFAVGQDFGMEFSAGSGFETVETVQQSHASPDGVISEILKAHPDGLNGKQIKELAKAQRIGKHQVDDFLKGLPSAPGKGREKIYRSAEAAPTVLVPEMRVP